MFNYEPKLFPNANFPMGKTTLCNKGSRELKKLTNDEILDKISFSIEELRDVEGLNKIGEIIITLYQDRDGFVQLFDSVINLLELHGFKNYLVLREENDKLYFALEVSFC